MAFNKRDFSFLDLESEFEKAEAVVLPAPFEGGISYMAGTANGPEAIINASRELEYFDLEFGSEPCKKFSCFTAKDLELGNGTDSALKTIFQAFNNLLENKKFVLMLGGDHSVSIGAFEALSKKFARNELTVLQLDAHADLRDNYLDSKFNHADVMRRAREKFDCVQAGIRSISSEEIDFIQKNKIKNVFFLPDFDAKKIVSACKENVYLTLDLDALDPAIMPSTGTPVPSGINCKQLLELLCLLFKKKNVVSADVVELMPIKGLHAPDFLAATICYKILACKFLLGKKQD
jgi:agmatinase